MTKDHAEIWRSAVLGNTMFLKADYHEQRFDKHFHDEYAIGLIDSGCQAFAYDNGRRLDFTEGTIALIAPGVVHTGWPGTDGGWRYRMLYPSIDLVRDANDDFSGAPPSFHSPAAADNELAFALSRLHSMSALAHAEPLEMQSLFVLIIRRALGHHAGQRGSSPGRTDFVSATTMRDLLEAEFRRSISLESLAGVAGLSRFQALRHFKAAFGLTPYAYLRQLRLRHARQLILCREPLAGVAVAVGFADQAHMTRVFRHILGYTPGALARAEALQ